MPQILFPKTPVIAVVISTTRVKSLLEISLPSVFSQSLLPSVVYIISDSIDCLPIDSISKLNARQIPTKTLINAREKNLSGAMNTTLSEMLSDGLDPSKTFIAVLDDDDWWETDYLRSCYDAALVSGSDWIISGIIRHENIQDHGKYLTIPDFLTEKLFLRGNPHIQGSNLFVRLSKILLAGGYDENLPTTTDRDLSLRLLALGDIKIKTLKLHLVHHLAYGEGRLSEKGSDKKCLGLKRFYYKYRTFMDEDDIKFFLTRARETFGCDPESLSKIPEEDNKKVLLANTTEVLFSLVIGVIISEQSYLSCLIKDIIELKRAIGSISALIISDNAGLSTDIISQVSEELALEGITLSLVDIDQARRSADKGDLGLYYKDERNRKGIAFGRTILHRFVYLECLKYPEPVAWIIDDDISLHNIYWGTIDREITPSEFLGQIGKWKKKGVSIVVGKVGGDPPVPIMSTARTQMLDLFYNLKAVVSRSSNLGAGIASTGTTDIIQKVPAYFYDFPEQSFRHLETPIWKYSQDTDIHELSEKARTILRKEIFRPASYPVTGECSGDTYYYPDTDEFGPVRGGNTIILDIDCLRDFTNSSPRSGDIPYRRGDTLWAIMNRRLGPRRPVKGTRVVISSSMMLIQDRRKQETINEMQEKLVSDTLGSAFVRSIDTLLLGKSRDLKAREDYYEFLNFTDSDVNDIIVFMEREIDKRLKQILLNSWRIRGLIKSIRSILEQSTIATFNIVREIKESDGIAEVCEAMKNLFSESQINNVIYQVKNFSKEDLVIFLKSLTTSSRLYGDTLPIRYSDSEITEVESIINKTFDSGKLSNIGIGKEGIVFSDGINAYKYFHYGKFALKSSTLNFINDKLLGKNFIGLVRLSSISNADGHIIFKEDYVYGGNYTGGMIKGLISILQECRSNRIVIKNMAPKNLLSNRNELIFVDLGHDIEPYTDAGYYRMCKRAYLTFRWHFRPDIQELLQKSNHEMDFPELFGFEYFLDLIKERHTGEISVPFVTGALADVKHKKILDYGSGKGQIADELAKNNHVFAYDIDMSSYYNRHPGGRNPIAISRDDLNKISDEQDNFDLVLLSLVLCTIDDEKAREAISEARRLVKQDKEIVIIICNPFNIHNRETVTHEKIGNIRNYNTRFTFKKRIKLTGNLRNEYHRPLDWYIHELKKAGFHPTEFSESAGTSFEAVSPGSEFLMIRGRAVIIPNESDVSLMIKASSMEWRTIGYQVRHIVRQLEGPEKFKEKFILTDRETKNFARQYDKADVQSFEREIRELLDEGIVDSVYYASGDPLTSAAVSERWFGLKCTEPKSMNGQPVLTTLQGFEHARSKYILQLDSDCIIYRDGTEKSYLGEMVNILENKEHAITVSFPVCNNEKKPYTPHINSRKWRTEVRNSLIDRERLFSLRPLPNRLQVDGKLELPWHRSLDTKLASGPWDSYRGSIGNACFIHVPNALKKDINFWYNAVKYHEDSPPCQTQMGCVDMRATGIEEVLETRHEDMIVLVKGRNVPTTKIRRCFRSLLAQDFQEFAVIYVDAASENGSDEYVRYIGGSLFPKRLTLLRNHSPLTSMENIFIAIRKICRNPHSVIVMLDSDDALIRKDALSIVKSMYEKGADLTVGTMIRTDKYKEYPVHFDNPRLHRGGNVWQHLRTFRKYLFDSINPEDLKINGKWISEADDWAYMIPMVEMSKHPMVIQDIIYFYEPSSGKLEREIGRYEDTIAKVVSKRSYQGMKVG